MKKTIVLSGFLLIVNNIFASSSLKELIPIDVTIELKVPIPSEPVEQVDPSNETAVLTYLKSVSNMNQIPVNLYNSLINMQDSEELSSNLLRLWYIDADKIDQKDIPGLVKNIKEIMKEVLNKK